ncbi:MAG TPA: hypothetical protein EYO89_06245 [Candidatus Dadabacteria bacterium]|nr:hypothetical protein [Candidatus Dadabacteria bacterium]
MLNINFDISSKKWLIVGGGEVATKRTKKILRANGAIKLVSPIITKELEKISRKNKKIKVIKRKYQSTDLNGVDFVVTCTNDKKINKKIVKDSKKMKIFVSNASDSKNNDFSFTSSLKLNSEININFSTGGNSPLFSKFLRILFEKNLKKDLLKLYKFLRRHREKTLPYSKLINKINNDKLLKEIEYSSGIQIKKIIKRLEKEIALDE